MERFFFFSCILSVRVTYLEKRSEIPLFTSRRMWMEDKKIINVYFFLLRFKLKMFGKITGEVSGILGSYLGADYNGK